LDVPEHKMLRLYLTVIWYKEVVVASGLWNFDCADLLATQGGEEGIMTGRNYEVSFIQGKAEELTGFNFNQTWPEDTDNFGILVLS
jgi:hypothetical protein